MSSPEPKTAASAIPLDSAAKAVAQEIAEKVVAGDSSGGLAPESLQALAAAVCRAYTASMEAGSGFPILSSGDAVTSTDVMTVCSALLKAADLQVFELGMWSSWTGR